MQLADLHCHFPKCGQIWSFNNQLIWTAKHGVELLELVRNQQLLKDGVAITTPVKEMCGMQDADTVGTHKETAPKRLERDEADIQKLLTIVNTGQITEPFCLEEAQEDSHNILTTNQHCHRSGNSPGFCRETTAQMLTFVEQRLNKHEKNFWDAVPNLKIKTFSTLTKKKTVKSTDNKFISVGADRDLFGRLMIVAKARDIRLKYFLSYELSTVPYSLAYSDGQP